MGYRCDKCELNNAESICSATGVLVCVGYRDSEGCGVVLTPEERHYYGDCCEACVWAWDERIDAWKRGDADATLDQQFGNKPVAH